MTPAAPAASAAAMSSEGWLFRHSRLYSAFGSIVWSGSYLNQETKSNSPYLSDEATRSRTTIFPPELAAVIGVSAGRCTIGAVIPLGPVTWLYGTGPTSGRSLFRPPRVACSELSLASQRLNRKWR